MPFSTVWVWKVFGLYFGLSYNQKLSRRDKMQRKVQQHTQSQDEWICFHMQHAPLKPKCTLHFIYQLLFCCSFPHKIWSSCTSQSKQNHNPSELPNELKTCCAYLKYPIQVIRSKSCWKDCCSARLDRLQVCKGRNLEHWALSERYITEAVSQLPKQISSEERGFGNPNYPTS